MALSSMTGFSRSEGVSGAAVWAWEIKSVNSKGLDIKLRLPSVLDPAHTAGNYLKREMIFVVGRKHAAKLRKIALGLASVLPAVILLLPLGLWGIALAAAVHLAGALAARWLFFAEAEHVVGLYYGARG